MFAAAAREVVFSQKPVVDSVREHFVPVALKAGLVAQPRSDAEGRFYDQLRRTQPAPQGIAAMSPAGEVIAWALSFDDDASIVAFFDHVRERWAAHDGADPLPTERFRSFPSQKMEDLAFEGGPLPAVTDEGHRKEDGRCRAIRRFREGTLSGRAVGRTFRDGEPWGEPWRQEHYIEDRFELDLDAQAVLAQAAAKATPGEKVIVDELGRALAGNAFLGMLDVLPLGGVPGAKSESSRLEVWIRKIDGREGELEIGGNTDVEASPDAIGKRTDGRRFENHVRLRWRGLIAVDGRRITRLVAVADGRQRLRWGNDGRFALGDRPESAHLPAGHAIDLDSDVRFGLTAEPVTGDELAASPAEETRDAPKGPPPASLRDKMQRLQRAVGAARRAGRNPERVIGELMPRFQPLAESGRFEEAEKVLDEALRRIEAAGDGAGETRPRSGDGPDRSELDEQIEHLEEQKARIEERLRELRRLREERGGR